MRVPLSIGVLRSTSIIALAGLVAFSEGQPAQACPFCNSVSMTLSEEIKAADVAVLARLVARPETPPNPEGTSAAPIPNDAQEAVFEVVQVLKGSEALGETRQIDVLYYGQHPEETRFMIFGTDPKRISWSTPTALSDRGVEYLSKLADLPAGGAERLAFFQEYLEDADSLLARDSYDEFAKAPYADVKMLREQMHRDRLLTWIQDPDVSVTHRRLYLTMLGICGQPEDVPTLEAMLRSEDRRVRSALDAMIACYILLKGPDGMALVEDLFLKPHTATAGDAAGQDPKVAKNPEYVDTYSAIMAVRFLGQESDVVPKERLMEALRHILDQPSLADLVIPDLARWQDWSVMDRLVNLFKNANDESSWVRVPVINYLRACPLPEAKQHIAELAQIDPDAVKRATQFFPLAAAKPPAAEGAAPPTAEGAAPAVADAPPVEPSPEKPEEETAAVATPTEPGPPASDAVAAETPAESQATAQADPPATDAAATAPEAADTVASETADTTRGGDAVAALTEDASPNAAGHAEAPGSQTGGLAATSDGGMSSSWGVIAASAAAGVAVLILLVVILRGNRGQVTSR